MSGKKYTQKIRKLFFESMKQKGMTIRDVAHRLSMKESELKRKVNSDVYDIDFISDIFLSLGSEVEYKMDKKTIPLWCVLLFVFVISACVYLGFVLQNAHADRVTGNVTAEVLKTDDDCTESQEIIEPEDDSDDMLLVNSRDY